jgi:hypothetical protein
MKYLMFGGPAHMDVLENPEESERAPGIISLVVSESDEAAGINAKLVEHGIEPPLGTYQAHYIKFLRHGDDVLYIFMGQEGEIPTED